MEIFRTPDKAAFQKFLADDSQEAGNRHNILSSLPLYTISEGLLRTMLDRSRLSAADKTEVLAYAGEQKTPVIHFVIRHPKMLHALSNFVAPVSE